MRRHALAAMVCIAIAMAATMADEVVEQPTGVSAESFDGAERIDVRLPGRLIRFATPTQPDGSRSLMLLVGEAVAPPPEDELPAEVPPCMRDLPGEPLALWRLARPSAGSELELVRDDVAGDSVGLFARDLDGDGVDELLLVRPGELYLLPLAVDEAPRLLLRDAALGRGSDWVQDSDWLSVADVGEARFHRPDQAGDGWDENSIELPIRASRQRSGLRIWSSIPRFVGREPGGLEVYATPPEQMGERRLRSFVMRPGASAAESRIEESWAALPEAEIMIGSSFAILDGAPVLIVRTMPAVAMNLFGELLLRIYPLRLDRSRTGHLPLAAFKSNVNMLQSDSVRNSIRDIDGDGQQDLLLTARQGFEGEKVVLNAYTRKPDGSFRESAKTTAVKVKSEAAQLIEFGDDVDGDGNPDLRVRTEEMIHVFPASAGKGKLRVAGRPSYSIPLPEFAAREVTVQVAISATGGQSVFRSGDLRRPIPVDMEGDGVAELIVTGALADGRGALSVIRFPLPSPAN